VPSHVGLAYGISRKDILVQHDDNQVQPVQRPRIGVSLASAGYPIIKIFPVRGDRCQDAGPCQLTFYKYGFILLNPASNPIFRVLLNAQPCNLLSILDFQRLTRFTF